MLDNPLGIAIYNCDKCKLDIIGGDYCPRCLSIPSVDGWKSCSECEKPLNKNNTKGIHYKCAMEMRNECSKCDAKLYKNNKTGICRSCSRTKSPTSTCIADECSNQTYSQTGYCSTKHGPQAAWVRQKEAKTEWFALQPEDNITDAVIRYALETNQDTKLFENTETQGDCLIWKGSSAYGYGRIGISVKEAKITFSHPVLTHRLAYALNNELPPSQLGPNNDTLTINHKCYNSLCVNPSHLEVLSQEENYKDARLHYEVEGTCDYCSAPFTGAPTKMYCGEECRYKGTYQKSKAKVA